MRVFAIVCKKTVTDRPPNHPLPCDECAAILKSRAFKTALQKPTPEDKNFIFTNHRFRSSTLGEIYARTIGLKDLIEKPVSTEFQADSRGQPVSDLWKDAKTTACVRYAQGVLSGKYDNKVFDGLVEAVVTKHNREQRGVGMQNFHYAPAWDELCHILKIHSPRAYESLSKHLPMRSMRSFR